MPDRTSDPRLTEVRALLAQNRLSEAREICLQIHSPDTLEIEALHLLGTIEGRQGNLAAAEGCFRRGLALAPEHADLHFGLGKALQEQGRFTEAAASYEAAIRLRPDDALLYQGLGNALLAQGHVDDAVSAYRRSITLNPQLASAHANLGAASMHQGDLSAAEASVRTALALDPNMAEAHHIMGDVHWAQHRVEAAQECYRRALACGPPRAQTHNNLGCTLFGQYRLDEAADQFREAIRLAPGLAEAYYNLANALQEMGWPHEAIAACAEAVRIDPSYVAAYNNLGRLYVSQGDIDAAVSAYRNALAAGPDDADATAGLAKVREVQGDWRQAWDMLRPLLEAGRSGPDAALLFAKLCKRLDKCREAAGLIDDVLARPGLNTGQRASLLFQAGNLYDGLSEFDLAFARIDAANRLKNRRFDMAAHAGLIDALIRTFAAPVPPAADAGGGPRPIFIVGMPRSGTTLVEQILARHPAIHGGGELPDLGKVAALSERLTGRPYPAAAAAMTAAQREQAAARYRDRLRRFATPAPLITDKMPVNYLHLGLIALLFPDARIIHCRRDARDTCLSCYFHDFLGRENYFSYDLSTLGRYYREYRRLMAHWAGAIPLPMLEVRYEELVTDPERVTRELVEFCGVDWDDRCLTFHQSRRVVSTVSYDQVREPIYQRAIGRWRHYERQLQPLLAALGEWAAG